MTLSNQSNQKSFWTIIIVAALILATTMGARQSLGLFIAPIHHSAGMDIVSISFALAIGQFIWGLAQPIFGIVADKRGSFGVMVLGAVMMAIGLGFTPYLLSDWGLILTLGLLSAAGAGAGSFSILIGATTRQIAVEKRSFASGFINAGGSFGQFIFAPITQGLIHAFGWVSAIISLAFTMLITIPMAYILQPPQKRKATIESVSAATAHTPAGPSMKQEIILAFKNRNYICLHIGFFTCGFHVAFLVTHLPGAVAMCGQAAHVAATSLALIGFFNIFGSLFSGYLGTKYKMKYILAGLYASRALMIIVFLLAPKTELTFYIFSLFLGLTWLATVPPTAGLVAKTFGVRYLATLFGLTLLSHQTGGFLGAYLGGLFISYFGDYSWAWYLDILLAFLASIANFPIKEKAVAAA